MQDKYEEEELESGIKRLIKIVNNLHEKIDQAVIIGKDAKKIVTEYSYKLGKLHRIINKYSAKHGVDPERIKKKIK